MYIWNLKQQEKSAEQINFLLIGRKNLTNLYFVTYICTLTTCIDIFQRFLVLQEKNFCTRPNSCRFGPAPPETCAFFEKSWDMLRLPRSIRSSIKNSPHARSSPRGPMGQN